MPNTIQHKEELPKQVRKVPYFGKFHPRLNFVFSHNARDFVVEEIPLYPFSNEGEHRILKIRKKNLTTPQCLLNIARALHIREHDIGYAGLKDKNALTYQYISVPNKAFLEHGGQLNSLENIKITESYLHNNKIKIGHLKGNKFFIRLKKINPYNFEYLQAEALKIQTCGFPNFFGYQRFGNFGNNYLEALYIKKPPKRQTKIEKILISSLQSFYFNEWLEERLKISNVIHSFSVNEAITALQHTYKLSLDKHIIKLLKDSKLSLLPLDGDVCMHYPHGKLFYFGDMRSQENNNFSNQEEHKEKRRFSLQQDIVRLQQGEISITGLLSGFDCAIQSKSKVWLAKDKAFDIESLYLHTIMAQGTRRYAWVYPANIQLEYFPQEAQATISFELPSGAYATTFLSYIKNDVL